MKKLANVVEVQGEGLEALLGERITVFAARYIYSGRLAGVNSTVILLEDAEIVYETGPLNDGKKWSVADKLPGPWYVQTNAIESFGLLK